MPRRRREPGRSAEAAQAAQLAAVEAAMSSARRQAAARREAAAEQAALAMRTRMQAEHAAAQGAPRAVWAGVPRLSRPPSGRFETMPAS